MDNVSPFRGPDPGFCRQLPPRHSCSLSRLECSSTLTRQQKGHALEPYAALGIIGGSGLYRLAGLVNVRSLSVDTPFGQPSSALRVGEVHGTPVAFLARHGEGHRLSPSEVPYAANVHAMKQIGVQRLVSISAVGSLSERISPRSFVVPDNIIDRTIGRRRSFFGDGIVAHVSIADPFCETLSQSVTAAARTGSLPVSAGGTYVCIEGPQFSTRAESNLFRSWNASIIGMTAMPEARLAREAELCYACLAMVTDFDVWHSSEDHVSVEAVLENLFAMTEAVDHIVGALATSAFEACENGCGQALENAILTDPTHMGETARHRLDVVAGRYLTGRD
jgi:5'-methylthioadenosine phosphorylase